MIQENITIHDKYQFELKIGYKILEQDLDTLYNIEMYFFIPNSLDINKSNYTQKDFYNDLQTYIRFKSPTIILRNIVAGNGDSPIQKLKRSFEQLLIEQNDKNIANYIRQIKMFICILKSALRDHVHFITKQKIHDDFEISINEYIQSVTEIALKYRELRSIINVPNLSPKLYSYYLFGDEYLSFMNEESTYNIINYLKSNHVSANNDFINKLYVIIQNELNHRKNSLYPSIPKENDDNEEVIFRKSILKKFTSSVLYLKTTTEKEGVLFKEFLMGIAAGCTMIIVALVAIGCTLRYGSISIAAFITTIIGYIFRDRVKGWLGIYFIKKMTANLFDYKTNIFTAEKEKVGWTQKKFHFTNEDNIPKEIMQIRNKDHITEIENGWMGEKIALYVEQVNLFSKKLIDIYKDYTMEGINNIMRFDISKFLNKMDDPKKSIYVLNEHGHKEIIGKRVYHLNLVIKYTSKIDTTYKRFRIVLNRDGIRRIEEVFSEKGPR